MKYSYYPGCSLEHNAIAYHDSAMAVANKLGIQFAEIDDWNCCGAIEYIAVHMLPSYALVARNLAKAARQTDTNGQVVAPCSACFLNLSKVDKYMGESPELTGKVNTALAEGGLNYTPGDVRVRHLLDVVARDVGCETIAEQVTRQLHGLRVAPYYGCVVVRPGFHERVDDTEYPTSLDELMRALGATVVDFPLKSHCCGGHMTQISQDTAFELIRRLLKNASEYEADVIVTLCPMCQLNLDAYQEQVNRHFKTDYNIPILYFTQLVGLALGIAPEALGIGKEFVDARPALAKIGKQQPPPLEAVVGQKGSSTPARKPAARPGRSPALPMPHMKKEDKR
jgi:heterodisulfide reductase subunit B